MTKIPKTLVIEKDKVWDVEVFVKGKIVSVITVTAKTAEEASSEAFKGVKVKIKPNYGS
jgi:hypothetical protein